MHSVVQKGNVSPSRGARSYHSLYELTDALGDSQSVSGRLPVNQRSASEMIMTFKIPSEEQRITDEGGI
jgi:hypothetical protein